MNSVTTPVPRGRVPVILVRHGVTPWNHDGLIQGWTDIPLSDLGRAQAERASTWLTSRPVARVITSDLSRAVETAEIVARPHRLPVERFSELREYHCGDWEGRLYREVRAVDRERFLAWFNDPTVPMPGGESMAQAAARAMPRVRAVMAEMAGGGDDAPALLIAAHGGVIRLIAAELMRVGLDLARRLRLDNGSVSILEPVQDAWALKLWNGVDHLNGLAGGDVVPEATKVG